MNNLAYYLSRIYYSLVNTPYPGYTGESAEYWAACIYYAVSGQTVSTYADGRDVSYWLEKWYRYLAGQNNLPIQGGLDSAVWLQKIYWHYAGGSGDAIYDGRSSEFWASLIVALNPSNALPPTISNGAFNINDNSANGTSVGTPTFTGANPTFSITAGNSAGRFAINASTGQITVAAELNYWNKVTMGGSPDYSLTVQVTNAGGSAQATITITVTNDYVDDEIQFLKQIETSGTTANDSSPAGTRDGVYSGVTLNQTTNPGGLPAPLGDGINDYIDIYSAALNSAFNGQLLTISLWFKAFDAAFWSGTTVKYLCGIRVSSTVRLNIAKHSVADTLIFEYVAPGGATVSRTHNIGAIIDWFHVGVTVHKANNRARLLVNGVQIGADLTGFGTWSGSLASTTCCVLAFDTVGSFPAKGYPSYFRIFDEELPASQIAKLAAEFAA